MTKILAVQNAPGEHLGFFAQVLDTEGIRYEYARSYKGGSIPNPNNFTSLIILGGPMGVYEAQRYPFLTEEIEVIRTAIRDKIPVLGICLGAQLMASALGGKVYRGSKKEVGWGPITLTGEGKKDVVLGNFEAEFPAFHWHGDTFTLPPGSVHLASSEMYWNQAFKLGSSYALQFHLEVTKEMVGEWVLDLDENKAEEITAKTDEHVLDLNKKAEIFLRKWLRL